MEDIKKELLKIAQDRVNKKLEEERKTVEKKIKGEIDDVKFILELIEKKMLYKKIGDSWSHPKYVMITKDIFFEDYSTEPKYDWNKGLQIKKHDDWKEEYTLEIKVNGVCYDHIGNLILDFENNLKDKIRRVNDLNLKLNEVKNDFEEVKNQEQNIMKFIKEYNEIQEQLNKSNKE